MKISSTLALVLVPLAAFAQNTMDPSLAYQARHAWTQAHKFLLENQLEDGSWSSHPALTALAIHALILDPSGLTQEDEKAIDRGFEYILQYQQPDGGIYNVDNRAYTTALSVQAMAVDGRKAFLDPIRKGKEFLIELQVDEGEGYGPDHPFYGGVGYGSDERPDLSNTHFSLEAIKLAEEIEERYANVLPEDEDDLEKQEEQGAHWRKALIFLSRCQNVKAINDMDYALDDGGFIYETGQYKTERSHSYGSMTYAGAKSLIFADVDKDDLRVRKAIEWISGHYTVEENPTWGSTALYYYYMTFSKCLHAMELDTITDSAGTHDWRKDLIRALVKRQSEDGSWVNENGAYWENVRDLCTAHALGALKLALQGLELEPGIEQMAQSAP